jgi:hypothetical protein
MTEVAQPIRMEAAILITATTKATGMLVLYPTVALDSIANVDEHKAGWLKGGRLVVSTAEEAEYTFRVKPGQWPSDIANALAARGHDVQATPAGLAVMSQSGS